MLKSKNMQGAALMTASMAAFTVNDTFFKLLGDHLPFFQVLFLRSVGVTILMGALAWQMKAVRFPTDRRDRKLIGFRTVAEVAAAYFFLTALVHLPIANVTAIIMALPLTVTLGAALFLGEPVGWKRLLAIAKGEREVAERQAQAKVEQIQRTTEAQTEKQLAITKAEKLKEQAEIEKETAAINLEKAKIEAQTLRTLADAEAYQKKVILQADNALAQKLEAEVEIQKLWADHCCPIV